MINALAALYDVVLIDCPPVLPNGSRRGCRVRRPTLPAVTVGVTPRREITRTIQVSTEGPYAAHRDRLNGVIAETGGGYHRYSQ